MSGFYSDIGRKARGHTDIAVSHLFVELFLIRFLGSLLKYTYIDLFTSMLDLLYKGYANQPANHLQGFDCSLDLSCQSNCLLICMIKQILLANSTSCIICICVSYT